MAFKIGDRVVVIRDDLYPEFVGAITTITTELRPCARLLIAPNRRIAAYVHDVALPVPGEPRFCVYPPDHLELYRDDGNEKGEWAPELLKLCSGKPVKA